MKNDILFYDRKGKELIESAPGAGFLKFLYGGNVLGKLGLWMLVKRKFFSALFGKYISSAASISKIEPFIAQHHINMSPYITPEGGFKHFNDFFYRHIKPEYRPIGEGFVSPADGRVVVFDELKNGKKFYIKGVEFNLESFLDNKDLANKYEGGAMLVVRLAPVDYHRYHFPTSGKVGPSIPVKGHFYSVSPIALKRNWDIFWQNQREYCIQKSAEFGDVLICDVGATLTGTIIQTYEANAFCEKGSEKGHFAFGGSTLIVLLEKGKIHWSKDILQNSLSGKETYIQMGEKVGEKA